jgi:hypothetical protein
MTDEQINDLVLDFLETRGGYVASASESELFWLIKNAVRQARVAEREECSRLLFKRGMAYPPHSEVRETLTRLAAPLLMAQVE